MRALKFPKKISILPFIASLWLGLSFYSPQAISLEDERFPGLSCKDVTESEDPAKTILHFFSRTKVDSSELHVPVRNWSFSVGLYDLANCWSLSRFQRLTYYLGRSQSAENSKKVEKTLDMIRLFLPALRGESADITNEYRPSWNLFPWTATFLKKLFQGREDWVGQGIHVFRNFKTDIETYQNYRFHDLIRNFPYVLDDNARPKDVNAKTFRNLSQLTKSNALPLILIRPIRWTQHVVLAKRVVPLNESWSRVWVYDSNLPEVENYFDYNSSTQEFHAPEVVRGFAGVKDPWRPVGVFIVDEGERRDVLDYLVEYFQERCE